MRVLFLRYVCGTSSRAVLTVDVALLSYWVCEKSDGIRVLMLVQTDLQTKDQTIYLVRPVLCDCCLLLLIAKAPD